MRSANLRLVRAAPPERMDLQAVLARCEAAIISDDAVSERERALATIERDTQRAARRDRLDRESIPLRPEIYRAIIDGTELAPSASLTAVQRWMGSNDVKPVLCLSAGTGRGKSVATAWAVANSHHGGHWRTAPKIGRIFAAQFGSALEEQEELCECYLLVIDDLGAEADRARMLSALVELIDARKRAATRTRTIITTNLSKAAFKAEYADERLFSRLRECAQWVSDEQGADMRRGG